MSYAETATISPRRLIRVSWVIAGLSMVGALIGALLDPSSADITRQFLISQDAPVLVLAGLFLIAVVSFVRTDIAAFMGRYLGRPRVAHFAWILAIVVGCVVLVIGRFAYLDFALSIDEFMAEFDARIIAGGRLLAAVAPEWRDYVPALQPVFRLAVPDNAYWISAYLPMNAGLRAVFTMLGAPALQGAVLAGVAVLALCGVARKLWPDRRDAAAVGVILLVCSSQFLITAATPYAMTAHLALNLVWLWLFLHNTRASHGLAAVVGFVACGLHQVAFHPLFVAPFVLALFLRRRWNLAAFYSAVYAVSVLFWILYWRVLLRDAGAPVAQSADIGIADFIRLVAGLIDLKPLGLWLMSLNLLRFLAWQNPLVVPLALAGLLACRSRNATIICLAAGIVLTLGVVLLLMPNQGHGWGYRYLHGCLGSLSLIAAQGWMKLTEPQARNTGNSAFALVSSVALSLLVLLPWRAYQIHEFVAPHANAVRAIAKSRADVVIVDSAEIWYGVDLVRNDPFLRASPKVMNLSDLRQAHLRELCGRYDIAIFDHRNAPQFGLRILSGLPGSTASPNQGLRDVMRSMNCGRPF